MKYQSKKADGILLRWAIAKTLGMDFAIKNHEINLRTEQEDGSLVVFNPLIRWDQAGPLFEAFDVFPSRFYACSPDNPNAYQAGVGKHWVRGVSPLHAGCRSLLLRLCGLEFEVEEEVLMSLGILETLFDEPSEQMIGDFAKSRLRECIGILETGAASKSKREETLGGIRSVLELSARHKDRVHGALQHGGHIQGDKIDAVVGALQASSRILNVPQSADTAFLKRVDQVLGKLKKVVNDES